MNHSAFMHCFELSNDFMVSFWLAIVEIECWPRWILGLTHQDFLCSHDTGNVALEIGIMSPQERVVC